MSRTRRGGGGAIERGRGGPFRLLRLPRAALWLYRRLTRPQDANSCRTRLEAGAEAQYLQNCSLSPSPSPEGTYHVLVVGHIIEVAGKSCGITTTANCVITGSP
jgi:hypothetical protein